MIFEYCSMQQEVQHAMWVLDTPSSYYFGCVSNCFWLHCFDFFDLADFIARFSSTIAGFSDLGVSCSYTNVFVIDDASSLNLIYNYIINNEILYLMN
jgi:hypothetical protein